MGKIKRVFNVMNFIPFFPFLSLFIFKFHFFLLSTFHFSFFLSQCNLHHSISLVHSIWLLLKSFLVNCGFLPWPVPHLMSIFIYFYVNQSVYLLQYNHLDMFEVQLLSKIILFTLVSR